MCPIKPILYITVIFLFYIQSTAAYYIRIDPNENRYMDVIRTVLKRHGKGPNSAPISEGDVICDSDTTERPQRGSNSPGAKNNNYGRNKKGFLEAKSEEKVMNILTDLITLNTKDMEGEK